MTAKVTLIDYKIGNLFNLQRAFEHLGCTPSLINDVDSIKNADRLVVPGVGAFGEGIENINKLGIKDAIKDFAKTGKPIIGICLGMQLLLSHSEELGSWNGLDIIQGNVLRFKEGNWKLPQITWNSLEKSKTSWEQTILDGLPSGALMYFNHSYYAEPKDPKVILATTNYANYQFASVLKQENVFACQFHPERSGEWGLKLLSNFAHLKF